MHDASYPIIHRLSSIIYRLFTILHSQFSIQIPLFPSILSLPAAFLQKMTYVNCLVFSRKKKSPYGLFDAATSGVKSPIGEKLISGVERQFPIGIFDATASGVK
jgi:hypothetical protein